MSKNIKSENLYRRGRQRISSRDRELASTINEFLLDHAKSTVLECPKLRRQIDRLLSLADSSEFRLKIPVIAFELSETGEWAFVGGRPSRSQKSQNEARELHGHGKKMTKVQPDVAPSDIIENGWRLVFREIKKTRKRPRKRRSKLTTVTTADGFVEAFTDKMVNYLKNEAQKHANVQATVDLADVDHLVGETNNTSYDQNNIVVFDHEASIDTKIIFEKIENLLDEHQKHRQTIYRWYSLKLSPTEESQKFDLPVKDVNRNRDAAHKWLQARLSHLKDD